MKLIEFYFFVQENVYFGQIAGMGEALSCGLAQTGFPVYKLVPTGTVDEVNNSGTLED